MAILRTARRRPFGAALIALLACALAALTSAHVARAYIPSLEEIYKLVSERQPAIQRAILETRTYVFDPLPRAGEPGDEQIADAVPRELPARAFRQKMYWIRNAFLGIETLAENGQPLHFYLNEGLRPIQDNLTAARSFGEVDVVHPFLPFVAADPTRWRQAVLYWGLSPQRVEIVRGFKSSVFYRLLEDDGKALWLEPELLRPVKLQTRLEGGEHGGRALTIEFREFMFIGSSDNDADNFFFPRTVNFLLDGRLFKQIVVLSFEANPSVQAFPITRLRALAAKVQTQEPVSYSPPAGSLP